jgi:hypothetical protein
MGPHVSEASAAFRRGRVAGMTATRALVVGHIASHRDCWAFRRRIAERIGCSVRTVQRAITQALSLGLVGVARAKKTEVPPGLDRPVECGWSHRWTIGWGRAGAAVKHAIETARAKWMVRVAARTTTKPADSPKRREARPARTWTADELDAELARVAAAPDVRPRGPP